MNSFLKTLRIIFECGFMLVVDTVIILSAMSVGYRLLVAQHVSESGAYFTSMAFAVFLLLYLNTRHIIRHHLIT
jgi:hypothetical protein